MKQQHHAMRLCCYALAAPLVFLTALPAWALGLGDIEVYSNLNEKLDARIPVRATEKERQNLRVGYASQEDFVKAGLPYNAQYAQDLKFSIEDKNDGSLYVIAVSSKPIREPILLLLIRIEGLAGSLLREYTALLDFASSSDFSGDSGKSPQIRLPIATANRTPSPQTTPTTVAKSGGSANRTTPIGTTTRARPARAIQVQGGSYMVQGGDTLWAIALSVRSGNSYSIQQIMISLLQNNPDAFFLGGNINALHKGVVLNIPDFGATGALSQTQAIAAVGEQNQLWLDYKRGRVARLPSQLPVATTPPVQTNPQATPRVTPKVVPKTATSTAPAAPSTQPPAAPPAKPKQQAEPRVQLLSADDGGGQGGDIESLRRRLAIAEEEAQSRTQEVGELAERQQENEAIINDLKRMVELRDNELAIMQNQIRESEKRSTQIEQGSVQAQQQVEEQAQRLAEQQAAAQQQAQQQAEEQAQRLAEQQAAAQQQAQQQAEEQAQRLAEQQAAAQQQAQQQAEEQAQRLAEQQAVAQQQAAEQAQRLAEQQAAAQQQAAEQAQRLAEQQAAAQQQTQNLTDQQAAAQQQAAEQAQRLAEQQQAAQQQPAGQPKQQPLPAEQQAAEQQPEQQQPAGDATQESMLDSIIGKSQAILSDLGQRANGFAASISSFAASISSSMRDIASSDYSSLMTPRNMGIAGAVVAVPLIAGLVVYLRRRKQEFSEEDEEEDEEDEEENFDDLAEDDADGLVTEFTGADDDDVTSIASPAAADSAAADIESELDASNDELAATEIMSLDLDEFEELDVGDEGDIDGGMAEFNVLIAYGHYDKALDLIDEEIVKAPDNNSLKVKRLEVYASQGDQQGFEKHASELKDSISEDSDEWKSVISMWGEMDTKRELFATDHGAGEDLASTQRLTPEMAKKAMESAESGVDTDSNLGGGDDDGLDLSVGGEQQDDLSMDIDSGDAGLDIDSGDAGLDMDSGDAGLDMDSGDAGLDMDSGDAGLDMDSGDAGLDMDAGDASLDMDAGLQKADSDAEAGVAGGDYSDESLSDADLTAAAESAFDLDEEASEDELLATAAGYGSGIGGAAGAPSDLDMDGGLEGMDLSGSEEGIAAAAGAPSGLDMDGGLEGMDLSGSEEGIAAAAGAPSGLDMDGGLEGMDLSGSEEGIAAADSESSGLDMDDSLEGMDFSGSDEGGASDESDLTDSDLTELVAEEGGDTNIGTLESDALRENEKSVVDLDTAIQEADDAEAAAKEVIHEPAPKVDDAPVPELGAAEDVDELRNAMDELGGDVSLSSGNADADDVSEIDISELDPVETDEDISAVAEDDEGDIELDDSETTGNNTVEASGESSLGEDDIELDIDIGDGNDEVDDYEDDDDDGSETDPGTKLDLARAYMELGDTDSAADALKDVLKQGDETQQQEAKTLLSQIS